MNDRPEATELLQAVEDFLRQELLSSLDGHLAYQVRVAANVVAMVTREMETDEADLESEWTSLMDILGKTVDQPENRSELRSALLEANRLLVERIRSGEADTEPLRGAVLAHLRKTMDAKLRVSLGDRA